MSHNAELFGALPSQLSSAEDFLDYFGIDYDTAVLNTSRLHILKRYYQYLSSDEHTGETDASALQNRCRLLLQRAYSDFVRSTPAQEKVFKVLSESGGQRVSFQRLRDTLPSRRMA